IYPVTGSTQNLWPRYNIYDTLYLPSSPDTIYILNPDLVQDSVNVYFVAANDPNTIWVDQYAYHNYRYGVNPLTIGVATFDGVDDTGYPYQFTLPTSYGIADFLTSKPINLNFPAGDSVYFSFFYQPQGLGEAPDVSDSLVLEFFSPVTGIWEHIWGVPGSALVDFTQKVIKIENTDYLQDGFRFRFKNYATLSGNLDHWHIDFVELRRFTSMANATLLDDVAFRFPPYTLLKEHTSIPWKHFKWAPATYMRDTVTIFARNNNHLSSRLVVDTMRVYYKGIEQIKIPYPSTSSINPSTNFKLTFDILGAGFVYNDLVNDTSAIFDIEFAHFTNPDERDENDTTRCEQVFENYYAYDDGTAEAAYGPQGFNSRLAYKFTIAQPDTLRSVQIHFQPSVTDVSSKPFYLTIWDDDGTSGKPGTVIYENTAQLFPVYTSLRNGFYEYHFETWQVISGSFYVGYQQVDDEKLNVGFDYNLNNKTKIYWSASANGSWNQTGFDGSLLMRPVFTSKLDYLMGIPVENNQAFTENIAVNVYPNPTTTLLNIECGLEAPFKAEIVDLSGRVISHYAEVRSSVDVSALNNGMYLLKLSSAGREVVTRFMVQR
ncbi:MAG: T9SS type A sorting domain-containing protein, partial [Flavobacteriales bacterium]